MTERLLLVDGNNLLIRSIKAMEGHGVDMSSDAGTNTGPLVVFVNCLSRYVKELRPDRLVVCWDGGRSPWRMSIYDGYKANRAERPDVEGEEGAFALAKEFLSLSNIHHFSVRGFEADDLIAYYWSRQSSGDQVTILSGDKDFLQLVDGSTIQVQPSVDRHWTPERIADELGCQAHDLPFVKALTGDTSDNIPGVPGFGHKTAVRALEAHGWDLEALLRTDDPKWLRKIDGHEGEARRNLALVNLRELGQVPQLADAEVPKFHPTTGTGLLWSGLMDFCRRYQLASIESRLRDERLWGEA